jgi:hypothetical protein
MGMAAVVAMACACGGSKKKVDDTGDDDYVYGQQKEHEDTEGELIPEEKFEEIKRTFERKASTVARCFPEAVAAGELEKNDRVKLTLGLEIQPDGSSEKMEILASSKRSETLEACVMKSVSRWEFSTLPKPLQYSYMFTLQRF